MKTSEILNSLQFSHTIRRLCYQLIENHNDFSNSALIGLQPNGIYVANRIKKELEIICKKEILTGTLDITFYRDDFRRKDTPLAAETSEMNFLIEDKKVVIIDDVLFSGRSIRAALSAIQSYGRPKNIELLVLIDRRFSRHLPIQPNYKGRQVDAINEEKVLVTWKETHKKDAVFIELK